MQGSVRLVGGTIPNEGRVEICDQNAWGTVCDNSWDITDAGVACHSAGYSRFSKMLLWCKYRKASVIIVVVCLLKKTNFFFAQLD